MPQWQVTDNHTGDTFTIDADETPSQEFVADYLQKQQEEKDKDFDSAISMFNRLHAGPGAPPPSLAPVRPPTPQQPEATPEIEPPKMGPYRQAFPKNWQEMAEGVGGPMRTEEERTIEQMKEIHGEQDTPTDEFFRSHPELKPSAYGILGGPTDIPAPRMSKSEAKALGLPDFLAGVASGTQEAIADFVDFTTSTMGIGTALTGGVAGEASAMAQLPARMGRSTLGDLMADQGYMESAQTAGKTGAGISKGMTTAFAADMAKNLPDQFEAITEAIKSGDTAAATRGTLNAAMTLWVMKHGAEANVGPGAPVERAAPPVAERPIELPTAEAAAPIEIKESDFPTELQRPEIAATPRPFFDRQSEALGLSRPSTAPTVEDVRAQRAAEAAKPETPKEPFIAAEKTEGDQAHVEKKHEVDLNTDEAVDWLKDNEGSKLTPFRGKFGGGITGWAHEVGSKITTQAELDTLAKAWTDYTAQTKAAMKAKDMNTASVTGPKAQILHEAYQAATGQRLDGIAAKENFGAIASIRKHIPDYEPPMRPKGEIGKPEINPETGLTKAEQETSNELYAKYTGILNKEFPGKEVIDQDLVKLRLALVANPHLLELSKDSPLASAIVGGWHKEGQLMHKALQKFGVDPKELEALFAIERKGSKHLAEKEAAKEAAPPTATPRVSSMFDTLPPTVEDVRAQRALEGRQAEDEKARAEGVIAKGPTKDNPSKDNAEFRMEWRARKLTPDDFFLTASEEDRMRMDPKSAWVVEQRRVDIEGGKETPGKWQYPTLGKSKGDAIRNTVGSTDFEQARSLDETHSQEITRLHKLDDISKRRAELERQLKAPDRYTKYPLAQEFQERYDAEIRARRLTKKVAEGKADQKIIDAIKKPLREEFFKRKAEIEKEIEALKKEAEQIKSGKPAAKEKAPTVEKPKPTTAPTKPTKHQKKLLRPQQISDFRQGVDKVERRGDKTFVVDTEGQRAPIEVQHDALTPETEANLRSLPKDKLEEYRRQTAETPFLSAEGKAERLKIFDELMKVEKPTAKAPKKTFTVTLRFKFPAWNEKEGIPFEIEAENKADAIKKARREASNAGHTIGRGPHSFTAKEIPAEEAPIKTEHAKLAEQIEQAGLDFRDLYERAQDGEKLTQADIDSVIGKLNEAQKRKMAAAIGSVRRIFEKQQAAPERAQRFQEPDTRRVEAGGEEESGAEKPPPEQTEMRLTAEKKTEAPKPTETPPPPVVEPPKPPETTQPADVVEEGPTGQYGIAHRVREERAAAGQVEPVERGEGVSAEDAVQRGRDILAADPQAAEKVMQAFEADETLLKNANTITRAHGERLAKTAEAMRKEHGDKSPEYLEAKKALSDWDKRTKPLQTAWHEAGEEQQGATDLDTGNFVAMERAYEEATGEKLEGDKKKTVEDMTERKKKVDEEVEKGTNELANEIARKTMTDAERAAFDAANKTVREWAIRRAKAENKQRVADEKLRQATRQVQEDAKARAEAIRRKTTRSAEQRAAAAENLARAKAAKLAKEVADIEVKRVRQRQEVIWKRTRDAARAAAAAVRKDLAMSSHERVLRKAREYIEDLGMNNLDEIRNKIATELGMKVDEVTRLLAKDPKVKFMMDSLWTKKQTQRKLQQAAKRWLRDQSVPMVAKALRSIPRVMFGLKVGFHGTVALGTHAPTLAFDPRFWKMYAKNYAKMYRLAGFNVPTPKMQAKARAYYESQVQDLIRREAPGLKPGEKINIYDLARRAGLQNDPFQFEELTAEGQTGLANTMGRKLSRPFAEAYNAMADMGNRGYSVLKFIRQDMFDYHWNRLPNNLKSLEMAKSIADAVNHATGVTKAKGPPGSEIALFAPRLAASRIAFLAVDPIRAAKTFANWKNASKADKWFATEQIKSKATLAATYMGLLALNQGFLSATKSQQQINMSDPFRADYLKFKLGGLSLSYGNPILTLMRLPIRLWGARSPTKGRFANLMYPDESMGRIAQEYIRSQLSPAASTATTLFTKADFQHRPLPDTDLRMPKRLRQQGVEPYTWKEFVLETAAPIPVEEAMREVFRTGMGMSHEQEAQTLKAIATLSVMLATGARVNEDLPYSGDIPPTPMP